MPAADATSTTILGISAFYHDSAACLVRDGEVVAAAQEERFTRRKHDHDFPRRAIEYCLREAGIDASDIDHVVYYEKPLIKFDRLLETWFAVAPRGFRMFLKALPLWLKKKLYIPREIDRGLGGAYAGRYVFLEHHESHAAAAFFPSPYEEAAILTLDGVGEWATASIGVGEGNRIRLLEELRFPHSLGLLYSAFTYHAGFRVNSGEYKLMGLAPYGRPIHRDWILEKLMDLKEDGSFRLNMDYFGYLHEEVMTSRLFDRELGWSARKPESPIGQREMDLAASIQSVTEEVMMRMARHAHELTGKSRLVLSGGVALNCVGNGRILREGPFESIWIQPAAGDAGSALGAALFVWHQLLGRERAVRDVDSQCGSLLGPSFDAAEIGAFLDQVGADYDRHRDQGELVGRVAGLIAEEKVVGHFAGRMEFGPRALGARSIIGDARSSKMQSVMNLKIKFRESFRPFAPSVLADRSHEYFELEEGQESPYMLLVAPLRQDKRLATEDGLEGIDKLKQIRSVVPAVTHVDHSARVQTVDPVRHPRYHAIIARFEEITGCPVIVNTSFNVRGEPIVCTPEDAYRCFMATDMDALVLEDFVLLKERQDGSHLPDRDSHLARFELD